MRSPDDQIQGAPRRRHRKSTVVAGADNVVNLTDAPRQSLASEPATKEKKPRRRHPGKKRCSCLSKESAALKRRARSRNGHRVDERPGKAPHVRLNSIPSFRT